MKLPKPFEGWEAAIQCQGQLLDEYQVTISPATSTEPVTVRCFIEAKPGKEFQMVTCPPTDGPSYQHDVSISYCVDGVAISHAAFRQGELRRSEKRHIYTTTPDGVRRAPLKFVPIILTDQEAHSTDVAKLGSLSIRIKAGTAGRGYVGRRKIAQLSVEDVPEKSKKSLVDQRVAAGTAEPAPSLYRLAQFTSKDEIAHAVLVIFTYRTKPTLQAMGLMPRDEQPDDMPATPDRLHPVAGASSELQDEEVQAGQTVKDELVLEGPAAKKRILALEAEVNELRKRVKRPGESSNHSKLGLCIASAIDLTEG